MNVYIFWILSDGSMIVLWFTMTFNFFLCFFLSLFRSVKMRQCSKLRVVTDTKLDIVDTIDKKTQYFLK